MIRIAPIYMLLSASMLIQNLKAQSYQLHRNPPPAAIITANHQPQPASTSAFIAKGIVSKIRNECGSTTPFVAYCAQGDRSGTSGYGLYATSLLQILCKIDGHASVGSGIFPTDFAGLLQLGDSKDVDASDYSIQTVRTASDLLDLMCGIMYELGAEKLKSPPNATSTKYSFVNTVAYPNVVTLDALLNSPAANKIVAGEREQKKPLQTWPQFMGILAPALDALFRECGQVALGCPGQSILCFTDGMRNKDHLRLMQFEQVDIIDQAMRLVRPKDRMSDALRNQLDDGWFKLISSACVKRKLTLNPRYVLQTLDSLKQTLAQHAKGHFV